MSLVPIIYTSLILFFGLMVIVLFFSYLSFRARAKANPLIEEVKKNQNSIYSAPKPIVKKETQIIYKYDQRYNTSSSNNRNTVYDEERINRQPIIVRPNYFQQNESISSQNSYTQRVYKSEEERPRHNTPTRLTGTRIEIMNDSEKYGTRKHSITIDERPLVNFPNRDVTHLNIYNFYSDDFDNDLNLITAAPFAKSV